MSYYDVVMVSYRYAPFISMGSLRSSKHVKYIARAGRRVHVITCGNQRLNKGIAVEELTSDDIAYLVDPLGTKGGKSRAAESRSAGAGRFSFFKSYLKQCFHIVDYQLLWSFKVYFYLCRFLKENNVKKVVVSGAPFSSFVAVALACRKFQIPWVADIRDPWADNHNKKGLLERVINKYLESFSLRKCEKIITVSPPWSQLYAARYKKPVLTVPNGYDQEDLSTVQDGAMTAAAGFDYLYFAGTIYPKNMKIKLVASALENMFSRSRMILKYNGASDISAQGAGSSASVLDAGGPVPRSEVLKYTYGAKALLLLLWCDSEDKGGVAAGVIPGKTFELLATGKPIIAVGEQSSMLWHGLRDYQGVWMCSNQDEIEAAILNLAAAPTYYDRSDALKAYEKSAQVSSLIEFLNI